MTRDEQWLLEEKYGGTPSPAYEKDRERLLQGEPVAYLIGHTPFLGLTIHLDSRPLIPRPETEWWTEQLVVRGAGSQTVGVRLGRAARSAPTVWSAGEQLTFIDLCAGSGAIGCAALRYLKNAQVYFGEIDPGHASTIAKNIHTNGLDESRAHICIGDLFAPFPDMTFDIIAANPPYIPESRELDRTVTDYEPALALRSGKDGLDLTRRLIDALPRALAPYGIAWIECDSEGAEAARAHAVRAGLEAAILADQYERPRVVVVRLPA